jgi:uncharacterized C2H2 Zn-finger protein
MRNLKRLLCVIGIHTGQREGGTMMFTCPRCRRSLWQRKDYSHLTRAADAAIDRGDRAAAERIVREGLRDA